MTKPYGCIGYEGFGTKTASPLSKVANAKWPKPSFDPIVTTASVSGSRSTSKFRLYQSAIDFLSLGIPLDCEYL